MRFRCSLVFIAMIGLLSEVSFAQAVIEGRVELPKTSAAPVMIKRYEIVTKAGVLATKPPLAVVYLQGLQRSRHVAARSRKNRASTPRWRTTRSISYIQRQGRAARYDGLEKRGRR